MKRILFAAVSAVMLVSCGNNAPSNSYQIEGTAAWEGVADGQSVVLLSRANRDTLALTEIKDGKFAFNGTVDTPSFVYAIADDEHGAQFILEPGTIKVNLVDGASVGTPLNNAYDSISNVLRTVETEEEYKAALLEGYKNNEQNVIATDLWRNLVYELDYDEMVALLETAQPAVKEDPKNERQLKAKQAAMNTAAGAKYIDIEGITLEGKTIKLSDIVTKGKPVVVDFWASWCGPCRREIQESLSVYAPAYKGKANFVGVAVWEDKIADTQKAVKELPISWPIIFAGGRKDSPTEAYGIMGIPHIMLIGKDGTIKARGLRGESIKAALDAELK